MHNKLHGLHISKANFQQQWISYTMLGKIMQTLSQISVENIDKKLCLKIKSFLCRGFWTTVNWAKNFLLQSCRSAGILQLFYSLKHNLLSTFPRYVYHIHNLFNFSVFQNMHLIISKRCKRLQVVVDANS